MRTARIYVAGIVLGTSLGAAMWLYTYRAWEWVRYEYPYEVRPGVSPVIETRVSVQPWWGTYGAVAVALIGVGVSLWLLPRGRELVSEFVARLGRRYFAKPS